MPRSLSHLLLALALAPAAAGLAQDGPVFRVVVHPDNPQEEIDQDSLSRLFLKKNTRWEDGAAVLPVDLAERSSLREEFSRDVHERRTAAIKSYWQKMIFSGRATPPPEVDSEADVLSYVRARPGAVGYVSADVPTEELEGVKVLTVVDGQRAEGDGRGGPRSTSPPFAR